MPAQKKFFLSTRVAGQGDAQGWLKRSLRLTGATLGSSVMPGPSAAEQADYASLLAAWFDRHKEYPDRARRKHQEGVVLCEFAIDREGHVLSYRIVQGSGYALLDEEASELMVRANPVPPPPVGMDQTYVVPIVFALN